MPGPVNATVTTTSKVVGPGTHVTLTRVGALEFHAILQPWALPELGNCGFRLPTMQDVFTEKHTSTFCLLFTHSTPLIAESAKGIVGKLFMFRRNT